MRAITAHLIWEGGVGGEWGLHVFAVQTIFNRMTGVRREWMKFAKNLVKDFL